MAGDSRHSRLGWTRCFHSHVSACDAKSRLYKSLRYLSWTINLWPTYRYLHHIKKIPAAKIRKTKSTAQPNYLATICHWHLKKYILAAARIFFAQWKYCRYSTWIWPVASGMAWVTHPSPGGSTNASAAPLRTRPPRWECASRSPHRASRNSCIPACTCERSARLCTQAAQIWERLSNRLGLGNSFLCIFLFTHILYIISRIQRNTCYTII